MTKHALAKGALAVMIAIMTLPAVAQKSATTEEEAQAIGIDLTHCTGMGIVNATAHA